ncbi:MAG: Trm112 family protein [Armatimonadota bacterium]
MVDERLLKILVCPKCKGDLRLEASWLICETCRLKYPVRDGVPIMLIDQAQDLDGADRS